VQGRAPFRALSGSLFDIHFGLDAPAVAWSSREREFVEVRGIGILLGLVVVVVVVARCGARVRARSVESYSLV